MPDTESDASLLAEEHSELGDWLIVWMPEEYEGWDASLHDTSACSCHAPDDLKCPGYCADPTLITREQAEVLMRLGIAVEQSDA
jgi:hypothetical protein